MPPVTLAVCNSTTSSAGARRSQSTAPRHAVTTHPVPMTSVYSASKAAIDALSVALAKELGPRNIRVNVVAPGYTVTDITRDAVDTDFGKMLAAGVPLGGRFGQPEEIAPAVVFLASDDAAWITGERLRASGGVH